MASLTDLKPGQSAVIAELQGDRTLIQRLLELGLVEGETIHLVRFAPLGDPLEIRIRGYHLSLRKSEAACVLLEAP